MHRRSTRWLLAHALALALAVAGACGGEAPSADREIAVTVDRVANDERNGFVVLLEERDGARVLPIWIGTPEATSIVNQIHSNPTPRPNTHDLARNLIESLDGSVERVVVTALRDGTYYGLLYLRKAGGLVEVDVRPSDGIAVALRTGAPIFVRASVFDSEAELLQEVLPEPTTPGRKPEGRHPATSSLTL